MFVKLERLVSCHDIYRKKETFCCVSLFIIHTYFLWCVPRSSSIATTTTRRRNRGQGYNTPPYIYTTVHIRLCLLLLPESSSGCIYLSIYLSSHASLLFTIIILIITLFVTTHHLSTAISISISLPFFFFLFSTVAKIKTAFFASFFSIFAHLCT